MSTILGVDPGAHTGIAVFKDGALWKLETIEPHQIADYIKAAKPVRVIFEDSRLTSFMFTQVKSRPAALKMARNVGEIDAWSRVITSVCAELGIACHGISPASKGAKLSAETFTRATGWTGASNQHTRDAAMCAWKYRGAAA
jgi:hypothetical protein